MSTMWIGGTLFLMIAVLGTVKGDFDINSVFQLIGNLGGGGLGGASNKRSLDYLIGGLSPSAKESRDKNRNHLNSQSCLDQNTDKRRRSTINPDNLRSQLMECDAKTLRVKVESRSGCAYVVSGDRYVWGRPNQSAGMTTSAAQVRGIAPVVDGGFVCDQSSSRTGTAVQKRENLRILNAKRNMCQAMKDLTVSQCPVCELKVLVDDAKSDDEVMRCVTQQKLRSDTQNARQFVNECARRSANRYAARKTAC